MEQLTFEIENKNDANLLIAIANRLGIKKYNVSGLKKKKREDILKTIEAGVDVANFGDPSEWQRATRKDRTIHN